MAAQGDPATLSELARTHQMCCHLANALPTAAPHTRHMSSLGAYVRAPGAGRAGAASATMAPRDDNLIKHLKLA